MITDAKRYDVIQTLKSPGGTMARWRGEQRGVLEQRKTGWFGRWREYVEKDGEIKWEQVTRKLCGPECSRADAMRELNGRLESANGPAAVKQNVATVQQFVDACFRPGHIDNLAPATKVQYDSLLKNHILPAIGGQRMRDVTRGMLQLWVTGKAKKLSPQSVITCAKIVAAMFRHADDLGFWRGPLPTERLKLPKLVRVRESRALTEEQVVAILDHLEGQERLLVMALFFTGMRVGEALALDWGHVNMSDKPMALGRESIPAHTIAVRRNWSVGQFKESPKTPSGRRNIPIHASLWVALMAVRRESGLVFPGPTGTKPMDAHNIANRSLKRAGEALGLGRIGFHVFRHTLASLAQAHGMTVGEVRGVLGHASAATSMLYVHGDAERARKVIEEIGGKVN